MKSVAIVVRKYFSKSKKPQLSEENQGLILRAGSALCTRGGSKQIPPNLRQNRLKINV
jgi:hypothetical protein